MKAGLKLIIALCIFSHLVSAQNPPKNFKGEIKLDIRDSKGDWPVFLETKAPKDAPNVLIILYDDTGFAAWSPYGGRINMPTMDELAKNGITYTQWHTTSVCSPTRSTLLTGRNHHQNGFGSISESAVGFPGYSGHIPKENATLATVLRQAGWSTFWIGKNHNVPVDALDMASSKERWPLGLGFDRFYGFIGGETNQWYPSLIEDNHFIEQPQQPENGYHLSKDLADKAIAYIQDSKQSKPDKPWFMWYNPGANHAPHHAPADYIAKYKGKFDDGYEAYRDWVLKRMTDRGIVPKGTKLTPLNPMPPETFSKDDAVRPWNTLSPEEKKLFSRMAEVYAAFSEYTDAEVGRVIKYLKDSGQFDNTLIMYCADNGASGEGSPNGSVNENNFFNAYPDDLNVNLKMIDKLGSQDTYNHYPTGWAVAFSTPFKMFKRYSGYSGGTADPLVICWPKGIKAKGEIRDQYHHCTDIVPTILEVCGVAMPDVVDGVRQTPLAGVSMKYSFDNVKAPTAKKVQYYEMIGTRGIWNNGWKAVALHGPAPVDIGNFDKDKWQLYNTDIDRSESDDVSGKYPEKVKELQKVWLEEAKKNNVLPLNDLSIPAFHGLQYHKENPADGRFIYYPGTTEVPEASAAPTLGRSFKILAEVNLNKNTKGVIVSQGSRFGGYSLFAKDGRLVYVYNFLGNEPEQVLTSPLPSSGLHTVGVEFVKEKMTEKNETLGTMKLYIDGKMVQQQPFRTQSGRYSLSGEGLCVGRDSGDPVSRQYTSKFDFAGGSIIKVIYDVGNDSYQNLENEFKVKMAKE
ncbi:arylsulfatase [Flavobacterium sp. F52]|uniref:arylsulfatase n=1 Tax=Flavobacterium sp. F52 TaxID=1202532 RepID=UPI000272D503|nr:arylsulfatase [Flavobacterium sp. F52]EJG02145.1 sulfatase [Flavobacterium sp. F52]